jgi:hypothetical protein
MWVIDNVLPSEPPIADAFGAFSKKNATGTSRRRPCVVASHSRQRGISFPILSVNAVTLSADSLHIKQVQLRLTVDFSCYTGLE